MKKVSEIKGYQPLGYLLSDIIEAAKLTEAKSKKRYAKMLSVKNFGQFKDLRSL